MKTLTKIERLDQRFPGLAAQVRAWFNRGVSSRAVAYLLREQYQVSIHPRTVETFRTQLWARERELRQEQKAAAAAIAHEFAGAACFGVR